MSVETDSPPDAGAAACPCRRGDAAAEVARQRPLLERAARGDGEAFARLYLTQVDGVYRYLLAWTGAQAAAKELTEQVFHAALAWLPITAGGEAGAPQAGTAGAPQAGTAGAPQADVDVGAWLVALARGAARRPGAGGGGAAAAARPLPGPHRAALRLQPAGRHGAAARRVPGHPGADRRAGRAGAAVGPGDGGLDGAGPAGRRVRTAPGALGRGPDR